MSDIVEIARSLAALSAEEATLAVEFSEDLRSALEIKQADEAPAPPKKRKKRKTKAAPQVEDADEQGDDEA